jgi:uncharacterized coiled-coil protein SlyX
MTIEDRLAALEKSAGKQEPMVRELRDAFAVTADLEARQIRLLVDQVEEVAKHADWVKGHRAAMKEMEEWMVEHRAAMKVLDERISNLVSGVGEFMRRQ